MQEPVPGSAILRAAATLLWLAFVLVACLRFLDPAEYGLMTWGLWAMAIAVACTDLGLRPWTSQRVMGQRDQAWRFFSNFLYLRLGLGLGVLALVAGGSTLFGGSRTSLLLMAGLYAVAMSLSAFLRTFFVVFNLPRFLLASQLADRLMVVAMGFVALVTAQSAVGALAGMAIGASLAAGLAFWLVAYRIAPLDFSAVSSSFLAKEVPQAAPMGLLVVATVAYVRLGPLVLDVFADPGEVGQLSAALRVLEAGLLAPAFVVGLRGVFTPPGGRSEDTTGGLMAHMVLPLVVGTFLAACLGIAGPALIRWLSASPGEWAHAGRLLMGLSLALPALTLSAALSSGLIGREGHAFLGRFMAQAVVITLILEAVAGFQWGAAGIVGVTVISAWGVAGALWMRARALEGPDAAGHPGAAGQPCIPGHPVTPGKPGAPGQPEAPSQPEAPGHPGPPGPDEVLL